MPIIAKAGGTNFIPAPEGTWAAVCVDVVDVGMVDNKFKAGTKQHKIRIVWQITELRGDGKPHQVSQFYTLSLHQKATLRKDLESWRGRAFTEEQLKGWDVEAVIGVPCMLNVVQTSKDGDTYSNVMAIMKLPKEMVPPTPRDYIRMKDRKPAEGVAETPFDSQEYEDPYGGHGITDDDLPF